MGGGCNYVCVWLEGDVKVDMGIPIQLDRDRQFFCLVVWTNLAHILFGEKEESWLGIAIFLF